MNIKNQTTDFAAYKRPIIFYIVLGVTVAALFLSAWLLLFQNETYASISDTDSMDDLTKEEGIKIEDITIKEETPTSEENPPQDEESTSKEETTAEEAAGKEGSKEETTEAETEEETTEGETAEKVGSISGFLWVDGNGSLKTDWDGLYNGSEYPLAGYIVSLYTADNLTVPIAQTQTDWDGTYIFDELTPGSYAVGLTSDILYDTEYMLPTIVTEESVFYTNRDIYPATAFSETIEIFDGNTAENISAGMRLPMRARALVYTISDLWTMPLYGTVRIDSVDWVKIRTKTVDNVNCVLLLKLTPSYANSGNPFNSNGSSNYEGSQLQTRMTGEYNSSYFSHIRPIAIKPNLGSDHSSTTATSEPNDSSNKVTMAGSTTKDIAFALSYKDIYDLNGGKISPLNNLLQSFYDYYPMLSRTSYNAALLYGIRWNADKSGTLDFGIQANGSQVSENPAVWVKAGDVYTAPERYLVSKAATPETVISTHHWLAEAVNACGTDVAYVITATEHDNDMSDKNGSYPKEPIKTQYKELAVTIPSNKTITLRSKPNAAGAPYIITKLSHDRHLIINGKLTIENIILDGNNHTAGGIKVDGSGNSGAELRMKDGAVIQNCNGLGTGGGVQIVDGGKFYMTGGTIANNYAHATSFGEGGGVYSNNKGEIYMSGGIICDNIASLVSYGPGGGVFIKNNSVFEMSGGIITRNKVTVNTEKEGGPNTGNGGGVNVITSNFTMSGDAEISYNIGSIYGSGNGGGVCAEGGTDNNNKAVNSIITIRDQASIINNIASEQPISGKKGQGGGIFLNNLAELRISDSVTISGNTALKGDGGGIYSDNDNDKTNANPYYVNDLGNNKPDPTDSYTGIKSISSSVVISGNISDATHKPPDNAVNFIKFNGLLLDNDNINYHNPSPPVLTVTLYFDKSGVVSQDPQYPPVSVIYGNKYELTLIPNINKYHYVGWKVGVNGALQSFTDPVVIPKVLNNIDVYLIYEPMTTSVTISKRVTGGGDTTKQFEITVRLADSSGNLLAGKVISYTGPDAPSGDTWILNGSGETTFYLTHGQSVTIYDVAMDGKIRVYETKPQNPATDRYKTYIWDNYLDNPANKPGTEKYDTGTTMLNMDAAAREFEFTNERKMIPPTGSDTGSTAATIMLPIIIILIGISFSVVKQAIYHRRKRMVRNE